MRVIVQRVTSAEVRVDGKVISAIKHGMLVLLGIEATDTSEDCKWLSAKLCKMRIFDDEHGVMNCSLQDTKGELLVVSQFTLFASTKKGNRPSYIRAARPEISIPLYEQFVAQIEADLGRKVGTGQFGAHMEVSLVNDGPVTISMDTHNKE